MIAEYPKTKTKPWSHQVVGWNMAKNVPGFYYAVDMGGGKTKMGIDFCTGIDAHKVLIICPKKVIPVWYKQFQIHGGIDFKVLAHTIPYKTIRQKAEIIQKEVQMSMISNQKLAVVLNYEAFWRPPLGHTYNKDNKIIQAGSLFKIHWDLLICDEAHRLKTAAGRASLNIMKLGKRIPRRLFLSGTPMPTCPSDVYAQYRTLDGNVFGRLKSTFMKQYMITGGFDNKQVFGVRKDKEEEFNNKLYSIMYRVSKEEILDLPGVMHEYIKCDFEPKAQKIYNQLESQFIAQVDTGEISVSNALTKLLRLSQITGGFATLDDTGKIKQVDSSKMDSMIEKIDDLGYHEPVVIFYRFKPEVAEIKKRLRRLKHTVSEVSGNMDELQSWQDGHSQIVCVQIQSGGEGIDLTRARYAFFYSKGMLSVGKHDQAISRLDRPGQTKKVMFYHMVVNDSIDIKVENALKAKKKLIEHILEDYQNKKSFTQKAA